MHCCGCALVQVHMIRLRIVMASRLNTCRLPYRAAQAGGLWGPALLLARGISEAAFAEAAAAMAAATAAPGAPLHTALLAAAGAGDRVHAGASVGSPRQQHYGAPSCRYGIPILLAAVTAVECVLPCFTHCSWAAAGMGEVHLPAQLSKELAAAAVRLVQKARAAFGMTTSASSTDSVFSVAISYLNLSVWQHGGQPLACAGMAASDELIAGMAAALQPHPRQGVLKLTLVLQGMEARRWDSLVQLRRMARMRDCWRGGGRIWRCLRPTLRPAPSVPSAA